MACDPYAPPAGNAIDAVLAAGYLVPAGDAIVVVLDPCTVPPPAASRRLNVAVRTRFGRGARTDPQRRRMAWNDPGGRDGVGRCAWRRADARDDVVSQRWDALRRMDHVAGASWSAGHREGVGVAVEWSRVPQRDAGASTRWAGASVEYSATTLVRWEPVFPRDRAAVAAWSLALKPPLVVQPESEAVYAPPAGRSIDAVLVAGYVLPPPAAIEVELGAAAAPYIAVRRDPYPEQLPWGRTARTDAGNTLPWGAGHYRGRDPIVGLPWVEPPINPLPSLPILKVYVSMNTVTVVRLPDLTPIEVTSIDLSSGVDAWCWSLRMELADPADAALLTPDGNGPRSVRITINGYQWTALIEGRERSRAFAGERISVVGRSRTALLDAPYAPKRSGMQADPRTARQLAEAELVDTGFDLAWAGADWLVPGGAWYWSDLTPVEVLAEIATAGGGVLQSLPGADTFDVRPRYPVKPWEWTGFNADIALPASWVSDDATRYASKPLFDAVIVRGEQQGVQARVTRQGSGGEVWAPQVVHRLITHADAATQRAVAVLGDRGDVEVQDLRIPLHAVGAITGGSTGLYLPLRLVEMQDTTSTWRGLSVGVSINARRTGRNNAGLDVWQTVSLERHPTDAN